jgi:hypothetical protein
VKTVSKFDYPASNESKNGPMANFPLYFSDIPLKMRKWMATPNQSSKNPEFFVGSS